MVFKRRDRVPFWQRVSGWVYPKTGWRRAIEYLGHRIKRLPDSPHRIAMGIACGVMASFTPFFGFHFVVAGAFAFLARGNILAALLATFLGNPVTFPFIVTAALTTGHWILGHHGVETGFEHFSHAFGGAVSSLWNGFIGLFGFGPGADWSKLGVFWRDLYLPYLVGGVLPGLLTGAVVYALSRPLIAAYQARRRLKILRTAKLKAAG